ncbi:polysaccharide biosynthesis protein, partial [Patescibacteria group bacterium]|nr:polysaccharide biosynthesis protein [Patescibacteria group bacterium]
MFNFLKKNSQTRFAFFLVADIVSVIAAFYIAFLIRFDFAIPSQYSAFIPGIITLAVVFIVSIFHFFKLYSFSWSYVGTAELVTLLRATSIAFIVLGIIIYIPNYFPFFLNFPRSVLFIGYFLVFIFCGMSRFSKRIYLHSLGMGRMSSKEKTLIVGAGDAGEQILRSALALGGNSYYPVGFADDSSMKQGVSIHGFKVLGKIDDIPKLVIEYQIKQIIIAIPSAGSVATRRAIEMGKIAGVKKIKVAPSLNEIIEGRVSLRDLKDVGVENLLGRAPVVLDIKEVEISIRGKMILIAGAAGSIGSELSRQVMRFKPALLLLLDQDETGLFYISNELERAGDDVKIESLIADIYDKDKIKKIFNKFKPDIVFHAAAYKHVSLMEEQPDEAIKNNIFGLRNIAEAAMESNAEKFIFISTDKAVNPSSVMGATKRVGEIICQALNKKNKTKFISVRFGNVLDSRGSVIPIFREQIKKGGPVEVTHPEMKRYFMLISEACLLVMQAGAMGEGGEVFVLDMGEPIEILKLAKEMIKLSGLEENKDIAIVFTGIKPGEKLSEEMLTAEEGTLATCNKKIFIAKLPDADLIIEEGLRRIEEALNNLEDDALIGLLKEIVLHYSAK